MHMLLCLAVNAIGCEKYFALLSLSFAAKVQRPVFITPKLSIDMNPSVSGPPKQQCHIVMDYVTMNFLCTEWTIVFSGGWPFVLSLLATW